MEERPRVICVILNTNRCNDTIALLESLSRSSTDRMQTIVLDNASSDKSVDTIRLLYPNATIISLTEDKGYAGNNNVGIRAAMMSRPDWIYILNEDTIVSPECIQLLLATAEEEPGAGILGPMVYHHATPDIIQSAGGVLDWSWSASHRGINEADQGQFASAEEVDWISGCAILVRFEVFEKCGLFDEAFYYYWEETDLCERARRAGWRILHVPSAKLWHKGVQLDYRPQPYVTYYSTRNRLLLLRKHKAPLRAWLGTSLFLMRTAISWTLRPRWRGMRDHRNLMMRGVADFALGRLGRLTSVV